MAYHDIYGCHFATCCTSSLSKTFSMSSYHTHTLQYIYIGGIFMAQKRSLLIQSQSTWSNILKSLSRANNVQEGHYAERLWAAMLTPKDAVDSVSQQLETAPIYWRQVDGCCPGLVLTEFPLMNNTLN